MDLGFVGVFVLIGFSWFVLIIDVISGLFLGRFGVCLSGIKLIFLNLEILFLFLFLVWLIVNVIDCRGL